MSAGLTECLSTTPIREYPMKIATFAREAVRRWSIRGGAVAALLVGCCSAVAAEPRIYLIEEDWELIVNEPDPICNSPQITFFTSPTPSESDYFQLQMNYAADDDYSSGGFHVAAVRNDNIIDEARSVTRRTLSTDGDLIRWTNVMAVFDNKIFFAVDNGDGLEWGSFGGPDYLVEMPAEGLHSLSGYTPQKSLDQVDIGFGANRVESLILKRVRLVYTDGHIETVPVNLSP